MPHDKPNLSTPGGQTVDNILTNGDFAAHFDHHVTPDLEAMISGYAAFIRLDMCDYAEALDAVLSYAWRRGGYLLDDFELGVVQDWIGETLSRGTGEL